MLSLDLYPLDAFGNGHRQTTMSSLIYSTMMVSVSWDLGLFLSATLLTGPLPFASLR